MIVVVQVQGEVHEEIPDDFPPQPGVEIEADPALLSQARIGGKIEGQVCFRLMVDEHIPVEVEEAFRIEQILPVTARSFTADSETGHHRQGHPVRIKQQASATATAQDTELDAQLIVPLDIAKRCEEPFLL